MAEYGFGSGFFGANDYNETAPRVEFACTIRAASDGTHHMRRLQAVRMDTKLAARLRGAINLTLQLHRHMAVSAGLRATANAVYSTLYLRAPVTTAASAAPYRLQTVDMTARQIAAAPQAAFILRGASMAAKAVNTLQASAYRLSDGRMQPLMATGSTLALFSYVDMALPSLGIRSRVDMQPHRVQHVQAVSGSMVYAQGAAYRVQHTAAVMPVQIGVQAQIRYIWEQEPGAAGSGWGDVIAKPGQWEPQSPGGAWAKQIR